MKKRYAGLLIFVLLFSFIAISDIAYAQFASRPRNPYTQSYYDSLKNIDYKNPLPIWGKKAYKKGFDVPYPYGIMTNLFVQQSKLEISSVKVGFNEGTMYDVSGLVKFGTIEGNSVGANARFDAWVFPFLNVYGLAGYGTTQTSVSLTAPATFTASPRFNGNNFSIGATVAGNIWELLVIIDNNYSWVFLDNLDKPVTAYNLDMRLGHVFSIDPYHPERNVAIWIGAFYQKINKGTKGSVKLKDVITVDDDKKQQVIDEFNDWKSQQPPIDQKIIDDIVGYLEGKNTGDASIQYDIDKHQINDWNMVMGAQYQLSKRWQFRVEAGFLGSRSQLLLSANYRFL